MLGNALWLLRSQSGNAPRIIILNELGEKLIVLPDIVYVDGESSTIESYLVSGKDLEDDISISTVGSDIEMQIDGDAGWGDSITIPMDVANAGGTKILVRHKDE